MKIINPATNEVLEEVQEDSTQTVSNKFQILTEGLRDWKETSLQQRIQCIKKFSELLEQKKDELARDLTLESGKPISESYNEIVGAVKKLTFFLNESEGLLKECTVNEDGNTQERIGYDPLGVVANISAWNYPYLVGINIFIPALICGNTVFYKPSEYAILTGKNITNLLHQSGIPENVFQMCIGAAEIGKEVLKQNFDGYFFTGSYKTGKYIAESVASRLVPVGLELGGKDPLYVTDEVENISLTAQAVVEGGFYNNGQSCCSVERVYVHKKVYDEFLKQLVSYAKSLKVGDPLNTDTQQGAITQKAHLQFLKSQVDDAINKGAKLELGGQILTGHGNFFAPTVLSHVDHSMEIMREESFGPIIGVMSVESDEQAIELMNDTEYGLTSAVYCGNSERGMRILKQINSGTGYLNCCDRVSGYLPWSGRGHSGLGTTLSKHGLFAFCHPKGLHLRS